MHESIETHKVDHPRWLVVLVDKVLDAITPYGVMGPLSYWWWEPCSVGNVGDDWVVAVFPTPNELSGGPDDGELATPGFKIDITSVTSSFSSIPEVSWNTPEVYDLELDGPEVGIKGEFMDRQVWLRIFSAPPADESPSLVVDVKRGRFWKKPV